MRVLGISGSLRSSSHNRALLHAAAEHLPEGAHMVLFDRLRDIPAYDEDLEQSGPRPAAVAVLNAAIDSADAVLFATPEYNGSVPGALKNALDWVSRPVADNPLRGKPVAVVGASTGLFGAVWAQAELRKVLQTIGAQVAGEGELGLPHAHEAFDDDGSLIDQDHTDGLAALVGELVDAARTIGDERAAA